MDLGDMLFGSGGELETKQVSALSRPQDALLNMLIQQLGGMSNSPAGMSAPGGKMTREQLFAQASGGGPPMSPNSSLDFNTGNFLSEAEQTSLAGMEERAMMRATGGLEQQSMDALGEIISARGETGGGFEDFFQTNVQDPALRDFETKIKPQIGRDFGGSSFFSSERASADRNASNDLMTSLTSSRAKLAMDERKQNADRLMTAMGLAPEIDRVNTATRTQELDAFGRERAAKNERVAQLLALLGVKSVENLGGMTGGTTGVVQSFLGGGGGAALGGMIAASDRRLKENVERVGQTPGGAPLYRFNYIGERAPRIGVMADEVEHIPGAVIEIRGLKYVDYSKVN